MAFKERSKLDMKHMMRLFKQPGFVDFNYDNLKLGIDLAENRDFAVVSLGRNPFAPDGSGRFAILAAGIHHPGTAHAVKFLANTSNFVRHPFGGVIEVQVPRDDLRNIPWHEKIPKSHAEWHRVGAGAGQLEYSPESLLRKLEEWRTRFAKGEVLTDIEMAIEEPAGSGGTRRPREIEEHIKLIKQLADAARSPTAAASAEVAT